MLYQLVCLSTIEPTENMLWKATCNPLHPPHTNLSRVFNHFQTYCVGGFFWFSERLLAGMLIRMDMHIHTTQDYLGIVRILPCILRRHYNSWKKTLECSFTTAADEQNTLKIHEIYIGILCSDKTFAHIIRSPAHTLIVSSLENKPCWFIIMKFWVESRRKQKTEQKAHIVTSTGNTKAVSK